MAEEPTLFDAEGLAQDVQMTVGDSPLARPARVGFLAGMLAVWFLDGKPTAAEKVWLRDVARETLQRIEAEARLLR